MRGDRMRVEEIPKGYKKTEIGIIPEDWEVKKLGEVCHAITDGTHKTPKYVKYGIPFYSVENVTNNDFKTVKYISEKEHKELAKRCNPEKGDILLTRIGDIGSTKLIDWDVEASIYVSLALLKIKDDYCKEYIYAYSKMKTWKKSLEDRSLIHATPKKINLGEIEKVKIPIPPTIEEQQTIANVLSDFDKLIESLDKLIEKKKNLKKGAMQLLLTGKKRLPGFTGEWVRRKLGEIAEIYQPETITEKQLINFGYDVWGANGIIGKYHKYNHETWQNIITCRGSTCGTVNKTSNKCWITGNAMVVNVDNYKGIDKLFLYYLLKSQDFTKLITGSGQPQIVREPLINYEITFPSDIKEQQAIAQILSDMDAEIEALEKKKQKYEMMKKAAMELLLTGKIRLKEYVKGVSI